MEVYLVQHAESKSEKEDPSRPIKESGKIQTEKIAKFLMNKIKVNEIWYSEKLRAKQTAEILAKYLKPEKIIEIKGITPLDDPEIVFKKIKDENKNIMIVGHLPHLSKLSSLMLIKDKEKDLVDFIYSCVVCLERKEDKWIIKWHLRPAIL